MSNNINMPVKPCEDASGNQYSPVVYAHSLFNNDGTPMRPVSSKTIAKAYDATKTYPTYSKYCIYQDTFYKFTGSGTTTGAFDGTKWTETDAAEEFTTLNSTLVDLQTYRQLLDKSPVPSTATSYNLSDNFNNYLMLSIEITQYNNVWAQFMVPSSYFNNTSSGRRVQIATLSDGTAEVYKNTNSSVYLAAAGSMANSDIFHVRIYGVMKIN